MRLPALALLLCAARSAPAAAGSDASPAAK